MNKKQSAVRKHPAINLARPISSHHIRNNLATAHTNLYSKRMDTTFTIPPSYGAEIYIGAEGHIVIRQDNPADGEITVILTPEEARLAIQHIQQLLLKLNQES